MNLKQTPASYLAALGITPFMPQAGIFCGGAQGPLYPNPATLDSRVAGFDPYLYQEPVADEYTMMTAGDVYAGIGIGKPSINYRNPGHVLGVLDTVSRMAYGIKVMDCAKNGQAPASYDLPSPLELTFATIPDGPEDAYEEVIVGPDSIYPSFAEKPTDYLTQFVISEVLQIDPIFNGDVYIPSVGTIDLPLLFSNVLTESYYGMPEKFRTFIGELVSQANSLVGESIVDMDSDNVGAPGTVLAEILHIMEDAKTENGASSNWPYLDHTINDGECLDWKYTTMAGFRTLAVPEDHYIFLHNAAACTADEALTIFQGEEGWHDSIATSNQYEYRSLTELNSCVNLVPIQMAGVRCVYSTLERSHSTDSQWTATWHTAWHNYIVCDVVFNTKVPGAVGISVDTSFTKGPKTGAGENILQIWERQLHMKTTATNYYTWDRAWQGAEAYVDEQEDKWDFFAGRGYTGAQWNNLQLQFPGIIWEPDDNPVLQQMAHTVTIPEEGGIYTVHSRIAMQCKTAHYKDWGKADELWMKVTIEGEGWNKEAELTVPLTDYVSQGLLGE